MVTFKYVVTDKEVGSIAGFHAMAAAKSYMERVNVVKDEVGLDLTIEYQGEEIVKIDKLIGLAQKIHDLLKPEEG